MMTKFFSCFAVCVFSLICTASTPSLIIKEKPEKPYYNPCAKVMNNTMRNILAKPEHRCFGPQTYRDWVSFFDWAVWAYLSGDSELQNDERIPALIAEWMDARLKNWQTPPDDPAKKAKWKPNAVDTWMFNLYAFPLAELKNNPEFMKKIGEERVSRYEKVILYKLQSSKENFRERLKKHQNYLNMVHHTIPQMVSGYLLTGDRSYLDECEPAIREQLKQMMPNGSFPYRIALFGPNHYETDFGYYHAVDLRAAYLLYVIGNSKAAEEMITRSVPYYPVNVEPGGHNNDGPVIWWKDQWRNWWPHHIAMVAAVTGDGENAALALKYGSVDYFDNVIGAYAFRKMEQRKIVLKDHRTGYFMTDPDIRGWRSRFLQADGSTFSTAVTASPNSYTKASAMLTKGKDVTALHHARLSFRKSTIPPKPRKFDPGIFNVTCNAGVNGSAETRTGNISAIGIDDNPALSGTTWRNPQTVWGGTHRELWFVTPNGMAGLLVSTLGQNRRGSEFAHEYKLIAKDVKWTEDGAVADNAACLRIWKTDFPFKVHERVRRFVYDASSRRPDFQLVLSDAERDPEEKIQAQEKSAAKVPPMKEYSAGTGHFSLASYTPAASQFKQVQLISQNPVLAFTVTTAGNTVWLAAYNPSENAENLNIAGTVYHVDGKKTFLKQISAVTK